MIGFFDYTVVLTYMSLGFTIFGMTQSIHMRFKTAIFCLALSGLCDMFDGKIARTKKDRSDDQKNFGIQIDSLCDVICFGAFPAIICYLLGVRGFVGVGIVIFYCIAAVIRLGYFNVLEGNRQKTEGGVNKYYHGLPVTSIAVILPLTFMMEFFVTEKTFILILHAVLLCVGILFIVDFEVKKPTNKELAMLVAVVGIAVAVIIIFTRFKLPPANRNFTKLPLMEEIGGSIDEELGDLGCSIADGTGN